METIINFLVTLFIFGVGASYVVFYYNSKFDLGEENFNMAIMMTYIISYCFMTASIYGFISLMDTVLVPFGMIFMIQSGYKSVFRAVLIGHKEDFSEVWRLRFKSANISFTVSTVVFVTLLLICSGIAIIVKSNLMLSLYNIILPIYGIFNFINFLKFLKEEHVLTINEVVKNYITVGTLILLYELYDMYYIISNYQFYSIWGYTYPDPTHSFDIIWLLSWIIVLVFIPRFIWPLIKTHMLKKEN